MRYRPDIWANISDSAAQQAAFNECETTLTSPPATFYVRTPILPPGFSVSIYAATSEQQGADWRRSVVGNILQRRKIAAKTL
jgi:hypothetical protein